MFETVLCVFFCILVFSGLLVCVSGGWDGRGMPWKPHEVRSKSDFFSKNRKLLIFHNPKVPDLWAHNPKVPESKPGSATCSSFFL